jgi:UDP-GlcNAc:undecaprenyl-phosphate/decaprenyl-phosphate GlcNAc-1-phosphate transferase
VKELNFLTFESMSTGIVASALCSASVCAMIILAQGRLFRNFERISDLKAVQCMHAQPTPRMGGIAILIGVIFVSMLSPASVQGQFGLVIIAAFPLVLAGIIEDSGIGVRARGRLLVAFFSAALAVAISGDWLRQLDVLGLDSLMAWSPFAILFTIFAVAGICHAVNLVDGLNGFAGAIVLATAAGIAFIADAEGLTDIAHISCIIFGATIGFLFFNFPLGRIFLGDAGAYGLGFILVWLGIIIVARADSVSAWSIVLLFFWPIADTLLAIWRRVMRGKPVGMPDRVHFHQLVLRSLEINLLGKRRRNIANPLTTLLLIPLMLPPVYAGVVFRNDPYSAVIASLFFGAAFFSAYGLGVWVSTNRNKRVFTSERRVSFADRKRRV